jgi:hypothetical protein
MELDYVVRPGDEISHLSLSCIFFADHGIVSFEPSIVPFGNDKLRICSETDRAIACVYPQQWGFSYSCSGES